MGQCECCREAAVLREALANCLSSSREAQRIRELLRIIRTLEEDLERLKVENERLRAALRRGEKQQG